MFVESAEIAEFDDFRLTWRYASEGRQRFIERDDGAVWRVGENCRFIEIDFDGVAAAFVGTAGARGIDKDPPHHLRSHRKKLSALVPFNFRYIDQPKINLVHESGRLKGVGPALIPHVTTSHGTEFGVDVLRQSRQGSFVAAAPGAKQTRDF